MKIVDSKNSASWVVVFAIRLLCVMFLLKCVVYVTKIDDSFSFLHISRANVCECAAFLPLRNIRRLFSICFDSLLAKINRSQNMRKSNYADLIHLSRDLIKGRDILEMFSARRRN